MQKTHEKAPRSPITIDAKKTTERGTRRSVNQPKYFYLTHKMDYTGNFDTG
jgi:hypothetical protein